MNFRQLCSVGVSLMVTVPTIVSADTYETTTILNQESAIIDVAVPLSFPVSVDAKGDVSVADNVSITNNSYGPITIESAKITPKGGWVLSDLDKDYSEMVVGLKEFGFAIDGKSLSNGGSITLDDNKIINSDSKVINYIATISPQKESIVNSNIADVVFTLDWYTEGNDTDSTPIDSALTLEDGSWVEGVNKAKYVVATDADFKKVSKRGVMYNVYQGDAEYVAVPKEINGEPVVNATYMFSTAICVENGLKVPKVKGVIFEDGIISLEGVFESHYDRAKDEYISYLEEVGYIPNSVEYLDYIFNGCVLLKKVPEFPKHITSYNGVFFGCRSITEVPGISSSVINMMDAFNDCRSLVKPPTLPPNVKNMVGTFSGCTSLSEAPDIPSSVLAMDYTFDGCTSLEGTITMPKVTESIEGIFGGTVKPITLNYYKNTPATSKGDWSLIPSNVTKVMLN